MEFTDEFERRLLEVRFDVEAGEALLSEMRNAPTETRRAVLAGTVAGALRLGRMVEQDEELDRELGREPSEPLPLMSESQVRLAAHVLGMYVERESGGVKHGMAECEATLEAGDFATLVEELEAATRMARKVAKAVDARAALMRAVKAKRKAER